MMGRPNPLRVPFEFDDAIRRALNVKPESKPPKRKRRNYTKGRRRKRKLAA